MAVYTSQHPLVLHKLTLLRDRATGPKKFRQLIRELTWLLAYEALKDLGIRPLTVQTPMGRAEGSDLAEDVGLMPILRAGIGMVDALLEMIPTAQVRHVGIYRNEATLEPVEYYVPPVPGNLAPFWLILDPMLATGGTAVKAASLVKSWGAKRVRYLGIIAAPEGVERLREAHPEVDIHVAAVDDHLNDMGYIVPGLGDAGDRQFATG